MDNIRIAEWILARAASRERAAEIMGDLIEEKKTGFALSVSVLCIALALQWRWLLAVPAAMLAVLLEIKPYTSLVVAKELTPVLQQGYALHSYGVQPMSAELTVGMWVALAGMYLWTVTALSLVRYGLHSQIARLGAVLSAVFTVSSCLLLQPHAVTLVPVALAIVIGLMALYRPWRRPLLCIGITGFVFWGFCMICAWGIAALSPITSKDVTVLDAVSLLGYTACIVVEAMVLSKSRRWFLATH